MKGLASLMQGRAAPASKPSVGGFWDQIFPPADDPWKNFPDPWGTNGPLRAQRFGLHARYTRTRDRVYRAGAALSGAEHDQFEQLWQEWMSFWNSYQEGAPERLAKFEAQIVPWEKRLDQLDLASNEDSVLPWVLGAGAALTLGALLMKGKR